MVFYSYCHLGSSVSVSCFFFNDTATPDIYTYLHTLSLHDALPILLRLRKCSAIIWSAAVKPALASTRNSTTSASSMASSDCSAIFSSMPCSSRSEEHTSETPVTNAHLVCRLLLEKKTNNV